MRRNDLLRPLVLVLAVCAFGALDALIKGHQGGTRNVIGNVSAPWALVPFLSAAFLIPRRPIVGALIGAVSTGIALACYSLVRAVSGFDMGSRPRGAHSMLTASLENRWFLLGALGGAAVGVVGSWLAVRREWTVVAVVVASVLVFEPGARIIWAIAKGEGARTLVPSPAVWTVEVLCGCMAAALGCWLRTPRQRSS